MDTLFIFLKIVYVTEDKACEREVIVNGTIDFHTDLIPPDDECKIYKWHTTVEGYNVDVTVNYLDLDEVAGDYLIISPGK
jgi:hypothetical protein